MQKQVGHALCALTCALIVYGVICAETAAGEANPEVYAASTQYEFPPVIAGTDITHEFTIENKGKAALLIPDVKTE